MTVVAGVDFGTLSVRVTLVDSERGPIGTASASYPLHRRRDDPDFATQSHADQMDALATGDARGVAHSARRGHAVACDCARHDRVERDSGGRGHLSRSMNTTSGAITARTPRRKRSQPRRTHWGLKPLSGAAASIRTSGDLRSCCTGCGTTPRSATSLRRRWNTATWWRPR